MEKGSIHKKILLMIFAFICVACIGLDVLSDRGRSGNRRGDRYEYRGRDRRGWWSGGYYPYYYNYGPYCPYGRCPYGYYPYRGYWYGGPSVGFGYSGRHGSVGFGFGGW